VVNSLNIAYRAASGNCEWDDSACSVG
jgi:hypothetical protein